MAAITPAHICKKAHDDYIKHGSLTKAAKKVGMSQSGLRNVARREQWPELTAESRCKQYTNEQRDQACVAYSINGSYRQTAHECNLVEHNMNPRN